MKIKIELTYEELAVLRFALGDAQDFRTDLADKMKPNHPGIADTHEKNAKLYTKFLLKLGEIQNANTPSLDELTEKFARLL